MCGSPDSRLLQIYTNIGKEKKLELKITKTCGIILNSNQPLSSKVCRKCENFVNKMRDFRQNCQNVQLEFHKKVSTKRCLLLSPTSSEKENKKQNIQPAPSVSPRKSLNFQQHNTSKLSSVFDSNFDAYVTNQITMNQYNNINNALATRIPHTISQALIKYCPSIIAAIKKELADQITKSTNNLCSKKENASVLYNHTYNGMANFDIDNLFILILT